MSPTRSLPSVFVDSSAWFTLGDSRHPNFDIARRFWNRFSVEHYMVVTTNLIVAETHALILARHGPWAARLQLKQFRNNRVTVVRVSEADERMGERIIDQYTDKAFSLTDAISFAVMERLGITTAFAFDRHFSQYGLMTLPTDQ